MTGDPDDFVERLWAANEARSRARLVDVLVVLDAVASGDQADLELGISQAHILAGALGSFGRPGSDLLKEVEQALREPVTAARAADLAARLRQLATELFRD